MPINGTCPAVINAKQLRWNDCANRLALEVAIVSVTAGGEAYHRWLSWYVQTTRHLLGQFGTFQSALESLRSLLALSYYNPVQSILRMTSGLGIAQLFTDAVEYWWVRLLTSRRRCLSP